MVDFLGIDSAAWGAIQTIIITVTGGGAFVASYLAMQETRKDRKIRFLRTQLDDLYSLILEGDFSIHTTKGVMSSDSFFKAKSREYLAGPKLKIEFEEYSKAWQGDRTQFLVWMEKMKEHGIKLTEIAKQEREDISQELKRMVFR
jgi:hypothetical protein